MKNIPTFEEFLNEDEEKPRVGHTVKRKKYKTDPPDIGLYSKVEKMLSKELDTQIKRKLNLLSRNLII